MQKNDNVINFKSRADLSNEEDLEGFVPQTLNSIISDVEADYHSLSLKINEFNTRDSQLNIIRDFATSIHHKKLLVAQAGTGIGKTLSYILGALNYIKNEDSQLVISTNTIALQTQLIEKDLPLSLNVLAPEVTYEIAKGTGRYFCPLRSERLLENKGDKGNAAQEVDLFENISGKNTNAEQLTNIAKIHTDFDKGIFNGDLDSLPAKPYDQIKSKVNRDSNLCNGAKSCKFGEVCPYYIQRKKVSEADIVVTNHALLSLTFLNDHNTFSGNDGYDNTILVIDEGHKFPSAFRDASTKEFSLIKSVTWLMSSTRLLNLKGKVENQLTGVSTEQLKKVQVIALEARDSVKLLIQFLNLNFTTLCSDNSRYSKNDRWIMPPSPIPSSLVDLINKCYNDFIALEKRLTPLYISVDKNNKNIKNKNIHDFHSLLRQFTHATSEAKSCLDLYIEFSNLTTEKGMIDCGIARWIEKGKPVKNVNEFSLFANTLNVGEKFQEHIVQRVKSTLLTSATLESLGSLDYFNNSLKIDATSSKNIIKVYASPFDYSKVLLNTPLLNGDPNSVNHAAIIVNQLSQIVARHQATLVLFTSYKQLEETFDSCSAHIKEAILRQKDHSKSELLHLHKERIDAGKLSILFGVDSLSEGVDLQRDYLTCVVIAKLPFLNLSEPMFKYEALCIKASHGDDFLELSLPICSQRLIQGVGRLIRSELDTGEVFILDHRVNAKKYGAQLLSCLPMYKPQSKFSPRYNSTSNRFIRSTSSTYTNKPVTKSIKKTTKQIDGAVKNEFNIKKWDDI